MFTREELLKYADILLWGIETARVHKYRKGDLLQIRFDLPALPLAEVLYAKVLERGFHPIFRVNATPGMEKDFFTIAEEEQLTFLAPGEKELYRNLNGALSLLAPESLTHLSGVDPKRISKTILTKKLLREILEEREQQGSFGWSLCLFPTQELADKAGVTLEEYKEQIVKACYLDRVDPRKDWEEIYTNAQEIKKWLNDLEISALRVQSDNVDLTIGLGEQRRWIGISGHNLPSFEIFTSPDWRGTEGVYYADQPSYRSGNLVRGVHLQFAKGKVVVVEAEQGEEFVREQVAMDAGACKVGEFSLTDRRFSKIDKFMAHTLFDENFGGPFGNCHLAVGSSYADTFAGDQDTLNKETKEKLGFNDSALHWDLVNTEQKQVTAILKSGKRTKIYENGQFLY